MARQAVDSLYNFNPEASRKLLKPWKDRYPDHPLWTLFEGMELWWQILPDLENRSHDERFFNLMGQADYESSRLLRKKRDHVDALIIKSISNGYIARQYANRDRWISSMNQARKAYSAYQYLLDLQPDLPDLKMADGLKLYYSEYLPEEYPIVKTVSWFLPEGNKKEGLSLLEEAAGSSIFAQAEARYFLGNINLQYEKNYDEAAKYLKQLHDTYPNNSYYVQTLVRSYYRMGKHEKTLATIDSALIRWERKQLPYREVLKEDLLTLKGQLLYKESRYREAIPHLKEAFETGKELYETEHRSQHVISGYYLGRSYLETGNRSEAQKYLKQITRMEAKSDYRKIAERLLDDEFGN